MILLDKRAERMKRSRFNEEQIIGILGEAQSGGGVKAVAAAKLSTASLGVTKSQ